MRHSGLWDSLLASLEHERILQVLANLQSNAIWAERQEKKGSACSFTLPTARTSG